MGCRLLHAAAVQGHRATAQRTPAIKKPWLRHPQAAHTGCRYFEPHAACIGTPTLTLCGQRRCCGVREPKLTGGFSAGGWWLRVSTTQVHVSLQFGPRVLVQGQGQYSQVLSKDTKNC
ncbi:hypothetical protein FH972_005837 [Carpinus fangiana]|uniref:Uncharacterized protein n=1 Tax=Carpinus fangiana TaxID=176857 RepID=A0A5N6QTR1_9ROSI|nr:hypothetical protein FH972_005837 [Carpinus fangiana]